MVGDHQYNMTWYEWGGKYWQRFSSQVYLDKEIVEEYGSVVMALLAEDRAEQAAEVVVAEEEEVADRARL